MRGIVTVAFGEPARQCAQEMMRSARKHAPGIPICIVADRTLVGANLTVERAPCWGGRFYKVNINSFAPSNWRYILWLDADTLVVDSLEPFFQFLEDGWDMVMTFGPDWARTVGENQRPRYQDENVFTAQALDGRFWHQPMSGVFGWQRNERTDEFHALWANEWRQFGRRDQPAMIRALWKSRVTALWLGCEWNYFLHRGNPERGEVVLHFPTAARTNDVKHPGKGLWEEWRQRV